VQTTKYIHIYLEYHSVCPLVGTGTPHPLSRKRMCTPPPPQPKEGGTHSPKGEGVDGVPIPTTEEKVKVLGVFAMRTLQEAVKVRLESLKGV
jgi:hypothetical protein